MGNICIYNIVYVVYRTAVDGLWGLMFGGFTSRIPPPFLVIVGVDVPEPSMPVLGGSGLWGLLNVWVDLPCVAIG